MNINIHSPGIEEEDIKTIKIHRDNLKKELRSAARPVRDPLWQSTLNGTLIKHSEIKRLRKQYSFHTVDEINRHKTDR